MKFPKLSFVATSCLFLSGLTGCGDGGVQEVKQWMEEVRQQTKVAIPKLSEPKKFTPFLYGGKDSVDPFSNSKLEVAFAKLNSKSTSALAPDPDRRREPLESFPLDAIKMVGTLQKTGSSYALLQVEKTVFKARVGEYIGQNFGKIISINETEVELKEVIQDASGEWVERVAKLELQETKK
jgi:type IV pilus assembly protein PilP